MSISPAINGEAWITTQTIKILLSRLEVGIGKE